MRLPTLLALAALLAACGPDHNLCQAGQTLCGPTCVDLQTDPLNCGACGASCGPTGTCGGTICTAPCPLHQNGLGQTYQDCATFGSFGPTAALEAAEAWAPQGARIDLWCSQVPGTPPPDCLGWMRGDGTCGIWCYTGAYMGIVFQSSNGTCICFAGPQANWN